MRQKRNMSWLLFVIPAVMACQVPVVSGEEQAVDIRKYRIEAPVERLLVSEPAPGEDRTVVGTRLQPVKPAGEQPEAEFENPKVLPGKVRWHQDFESARVASAKSSKPVLLFQLLGNLDDRFC